jgi:uncharacterized protein (TIGR03437 family)
VGSTFDPRFPATPGAYQAVYKGPDLLDPPPSAHPRDAFVLKLNPAGTAVVWASYLGGADEDAARAVTLDPSGNVWITGTTRSRDFPNQQGWSQGGVFVAAMNAAGSSLAYSGRYPDGAAGQTLALAPDGLLHIAGSGGIVSATAAVPRPAMRVFGIANAAYGDVSGRISPGEVVSIYGAHIGPDPAMAQPNREGSVPVSLGGVQVFMNGIPSPLLYVSDSQINAVAPFGIADQAEARVRVEFNGAVSAEFTAAVTGAQPGIFQRPDQSASALNQDGSINSPENPAEPGSVVSIWVTGTPVPTPVPGDGEIAAEARGWCCFQIYTWDKFLPVLYAGAAPGMVAGISQINFRLPEEPSGSVYLVAGGKMSNPVEIHIRPR